MVYLLGFEEKAAHLDERAEGEGNRVEYFDESACFCAVVSQVVLLADPEDLGVLAFD